MIKSFKLKITEHPDKLLINAKQLASINGYQLQGDSHKGMLKGSGTEAQYIVHGDVLTVTILRKPMLLSWKQMEKTVRDIMTISVQNNNDFPTK